MTTIPTHRAFSLAPLTICGIPNPPHGPTLATSDLGSVTCEHCLAGRPAPAVEQLSRTLTSYGLTYDDFDAHELAITLDDDQINRSGSAMLDDLLGDDYSAEDTFQDRIARVVRRS